MQIKANEEKNMMPKELTGEKEERGVDVHW